MPNNYWFWWRGWVNDDKAGAEDLVYGQQTPSGDEAARREALALYYRLLVEGK